MREKLRLFAIDIAKLGESNILETLHIIAYNSVHAGHLGFHLLIDDDENENDRYDFPIEILNVRKMVDVKEIINAGEVFDNEEMEYNPEQPYLIAENENFPQEHIMRFKCSCQNEQAVADFGWPWISCRDCKRQILRSDLENVSGIWIYHPSN